MPYEWGFSVTADQAALVPVYSGIAVSGVTCQRHRFGGETLVARAAFSRLVGMWGAWIGFDVPSL